MTALELALLLCLNVDDAQDFIDRCEQFDSRVEALYDLEDRPRTIDDYVDAEYLEDLLDEDLDYYDVDPEYLDDQLYADEVYPCPCCVLPQD